jgi:hypothetical protein
MGEPRNRVVQVRRFGSPDELEVDCLVVFDASGLDEGVEGRARPSWTRPSRCPAAPAWLLLLAVRQFVEDVGATTAQNRVLIFECKYKRFLLGLRAQWMFGVLS